MQVPSSQAGSRGGTRPTTYEKTWRCSPSWLMRVMLLVVVLGAAAEIHDVVTHSVPFAHHRPFMDKLMFVYIPIATTVAVVVSSIAACLMNSGRCVTVTLEGVKIFRKGSQGSYTDYLEVPFTEIIYTRGGFFPLQYADVGNTTRRERLYAIFLPGYEQLLAAMEEKRARSRMQEDVASMYLRKRGDS